MARRGTKQEALEMIAQLPSKTSGDDIMYEVYVRQKVAVVVAAADSGKVVSHEDLRTQFARRR